jgi:hypothetical protein
MPVIIGCQLPSASWRLVAYLAARRLRGLWLTGSEQGPSAIPPQVAQFLPGYCRTWRYSSPQSGSLECAVKLTTLSPRGRASGSRALDEAESPTSPAG